MQVTRILDRSSLRTNFAKLDIHLSDIVDIGVESQIEAYTTSLLRRCFLGGMFISVCDMICLIADNYEDFMCF